MRAELSRHGYCSDKEEEHVERIECQWERRVALKAVAPGGGNEVEKRQHAENSYEHVVVDERRVAFERLSDHGSNQGHNDEDEKELTTQ